MERIDPRQRYHHPSNFHITLEEFGWEDEVDLRKLMRLTKKMISNLSQFEIELKGVNCFPRTIFAQVFDRSQTLLRIYKDIHEYFPNVKEEHPEYIPHVSIVDILTNEACKLVTAIESKYRKKKIGKIKVDSVSIVAWKPYLTVGRIEARRTIPLRDTR